MASIVKKSPEEKYLPIFICADFIIHLSEPKALLTSPSRKCHVRMTLTAANFYPHTVQRNSTKLSASATLHKNMTSIFWKGSWWL